MKADLQSDRPKWVIDLRLDGLLGRSVRVAAEAFAPRRADGTVLPRLIPTADLILPDASTPGGRPVYFEGVLESHHRRIGVVDVTLGAPSLPSTPADGVTGFRGGQAILLPGPALVRLAFPFVIEPLPDDDTNYWRDLRVAGAQFEWPWA